MRLARIKWVAILGPILFVALLELSAYFFLPQLTTWPGRLVMALVVVAALVWFFSALFSTITEMQESEERQSRELLALHRASLDIYGELSLDVILQKVVDQARKLLGARYGAISVMADEGLDTFVTSGLDDAHRAKIGAPPVGRGLLGKVLDEGEHLRLGDLTMHPGFTGFPAVHPEMKSLLAVPILCKSQFRGNLYIAEKDSGDSFAERDEESLVRFATQAAIAIDNAALHRQLRSLAVAEERARIGREMHDGMAQVLAYVNTKAQAVTEFLRAGRAEEANRQLEQLAAAARDVYTDVREGILSLRATPAQRGTLPKALGDFLGQWQDQSGIRVETDVDSSVSLDAAAELQLFRIIQEALANVRKHSGADSAKVEIRSEGARVVAVVADSGKGFSNKRAHRPHGPGFGLAIMRERAESVGGTIQVESAAASGTRVTIELPAAG